MSNKILFSVAARCEAAGRPSNEDNFLLDSDLNDEKWGHTADEKIYLGEKGALLVVCDGMGGMNAGEVASEIAVEVIKKSFEKEKITNEVMRKPLDYIANVIVAADRAIKIHAKDNPETEGMGSTVVIAWILGDKVHVGWCGDSRCYRFNPVLGLQRLSRDHSYVQELVDAGKLTDDLAFDHPNNNIITRSLGDPRGDAQPDTKTYELYNDDMIMLCSDGLCGTLRDREIEEIMRAHQNSCVECRDALWVADEAAGWHDNTTIVMAQIMDGLTATPKQQENDAAAPSCKCNKKNCKLIIYVLLFLIGICAGYHCFIYLTTKSTEPKNDNESSAVCDSLKHEGDSLKLEEDSLRDENVSLKHENDSLKQANESLAKELNSIKQKSSSNRANSGRNESNTSVTNKTNIIKEPEIHAEQINPSDLEKLQFTDTTNIKK